MKDLFDSIERWWFINSRHYDDFYLILILTAAYILLWAFYAKVFFYQRTVRKFDMTYNCNLRSLGWMVYPKSYIALYYISLLRFVALVWLFFVNWGVALGVLLFGVFAISIWPEQNDAKNFKKIQKCLSKIDEMTNL